MQLLLGALLIFMLSKFNHVKADDDDDTDEQVGSVILEKYTNTLANNFDRSFRMHSERQSRMEISSCKSCGLINIKIQARISVIRGDDVYPPHKYPWMVEIVMRMKKGQARKTGFCTGAIISEYFILTATHCVIKNLKPLEYIKPEDIFIYFVTDTYKRKQGPPVQQVIAHPEYVPYMKHDIALLKMKEKIVCGRFKNPICLPPRNFVLPNKAIVTASGWGLTVKDDSSSRAHNLKEAKFIVEKIDVCSRKENKNFYCLRGFNEQVTCKGDSGGPAFYKHKNKFYVIGVLSFGLGCNIKRPFSFFTPVPHHLSWIKASMNSNSGADDYGGAAYYGGPEDDGGAAYYGGTEVDGGAAYYVGTEVDGEAAYSGGAGDVDGPAYSGGAEDDGGPAYSGGAEDDGAAAYYGGAEDDCAAAYYGGDY